MGLEEKSFVENQSSIFFLDGADNVTLLNGGLILSRYWRMTSFRRTPTVGPVAITFGNAGFMVYNLHLLPQVVTATDVLGLRVRFVETFGAIDLVTEQLLCPLLGLGQVYRGRKELTVLQSSFQIQNLTGQSVLLDWSLRVKVA